MLVHVNGSLIPAEEATISPFDRGFVFGDGLYEGLRSIAWRDGHRIVGLNRHIERLARGLTSMGFEWDVGRIPSLIDDLLRANGLADAFVYLQVTRGTPPLTGAVRTRVPASGTTPTVFAYCVGVPSLDGAAAPRALRAVTVEDPRWKLGHLKSISLAGNIVASLAAHEAGVDDALMISDGRVVEGTATNALLVVDDTVVTPSLDSAPMLEGVTRAIVLDVDPEIVERPVETHELEQASELMLVGTTTMVASITELNGRPIGDGRAGPHASRLLRGLTEAILDGRDDA